MKRKRSLVDNRRQKVLEVLKNDGLVKVGELAEQFNVSPLTIRRDLQYLEDNKKLERFYGGATVTKEAQEVVTEENKISLYRKRIAQYAASLVEDGDTIFINSSSTALQMIRYIKGKRVIVITNNGKAIYLDRAPEISVVLTGGALRDIKDAMVGEFARNNLSMVTAKKSFIGCSGLSLESGMTTEILNEVNINELMFTRVTDDAYILADHTKFGVNSSFVSCPIERIRNVITDEEAPQVIVEGMQKRGIHVHMVKKDDHE